MKIKLSDRAARELTELHEALNNSCSITHFLNQLISLHYEGNKMNIIPTIEDNNGNQENKSLHPLQ